MSAEIINLDDHRNPDDKDERSFLVRARESNLVISTEHLLGVDGIFSEENIPIERKSEQGRIEDAIGRITTVVASLPREILEIISAKS